MSSEPHYIHRFLLTLKIRDRRTREVIEVMVTFRNVFKKIYIYSLMFSLILGQFYKFDV